MPAPAPHVLGIDAGATKTVGVLATLEGDIVRVVRSGGTNLQTTERSRLEQLLGTVMQDAVAGQAVSLTGICIGMAGADRADEFDEVRAMVARLGYTVPTLVVNDALIALVAGIGEEAPGVVIVAGTGAIAYGRDRRGRAARAGGWGYLLGDEGSGYWIGRRALRAVVRASDGRGQPTRIADGILAQFGVARAQDLTRRLQECALEPADIAGLATHVQRAAESGDTIASSILEEAALELALTATAVIHRLNLAREPFTIVLAGSVFRAVRVLTSELTRRLALVAPRATSSVLQEEPAVGAAWLAIASAHRPVKVPPYESA